MSVCVDSSKVEPQLFQVGNGGAIPTSALQLKVVQIKAKEACELNKKWHSRLPEIHWSNVVRNTHYVCYAAEYQGNIFAVGIWSSPVAQNRFPDGKQMLELRRLAISGESPKNTATRMIAVMVKMIKNKFPELTRLISYQDTEVHKGTIYKASNWTMAAESKGISWTTKTRKRNKDQTTAKKLRWELSLTKENKAMSKIPVEQVVEKYVTLREIKRDLERDHEDALKPINEKLEKLETWLLGRMNEDGVDSYKTGKGTAYKTVKTSCQMADGAMYREFVFSPLRDWGDENLGTGCGTSLVERILTSALWNLVDFHVLKKGVEEYIADYKQVPPGLNVSQTTTVNVRSK